MRGRALTSFAMLVLVLAAHPERISAAAVRYPMKGLVVDVAASHKSFTVSHESIPGVMAAMTMAFAVHDPRLLQGVVPGTLVTFVLVVGQEAAYAEQIAILRYETVEQDPLTAQRLTLLASLTKNPASPNVAVPVGRTMPDFTLIDQNRRPVALATLRGKIVAVNFIYTSCALPQFCFRIANHFGVVQKRFHDRLGTDLVLLTVTFDPVRDQPEQLAEYASQWKADPDTWHFLSGSVPDIKRVRSLFGVDAFADEGLMNHSSHTAVIDRKGTLIANIEGNQYTADELGDLIGAALKH